MLAWFPPDEAGKHKSSSSRDLTFLCLADIRRNNSHEVIARSHCDETLPKFIEWTLACTSCLQFAYFDLHAFNSDRSAVCVR